MKKKKYCTMLVVGLGMSLGLCTTGLTKNITVDEDVIKVMQQQLAAQAEAIADLQAALKIQQTDLEKVPQVGKTEQRAVVSAVPEEAKVRVSLYGQVNKGVLFADDGNQNKTFFVDNDASSTRIGFDAKADPGGSWSIGAKMEMEYQTNPSNVVNMELESISGSFNSRKLFAYVHEDNLGKLSIGKNSAVTDGIAEIELSGTQLAGYNFIGAIGGGLQFYNTAIQDYIDTRVGVAFRNLDGGRYDLIRYDTPKLAGFTLSGSLGEQDKNEIALRYNQKFDQLHLVAGIGYATFGRGIDSFDNRWSGSVTALLNNGLNFTFAGGSRGQNEDQRDDPYYYYGKIGYQLHALNAGKTAFSVDYGSYQDFAQNNDDGTIFGAQLVQYLDPYATQFYLGYRLVQLDRDFTDLDDINEVISGLRVKF